MNRVSRSLSRILFATAGLTAGGTAVAAPIAVVNWSFEDFALACVAGPNCFQLGTVPGWNVSSIPRTATFKPSTGVGGIFPAGVPDGVNVVGVGNQDGTASISQTTGAALEASTIYTLNVAVGRRADFLFSGYSIQLFAGNILLASSSALTPLAGTFLTDTVSFTSSAAPAGLGQPIRLQFVSLISGGQVDFDTVTLNAVAVPEPTIGVLLLAGLGIVSARRRAQSVK